MAPEIARPWHGILVAAALPLRDDLCVDLDAYAEHVRWLAAGGATASCPTGRSASTRR